MTLFTKFFVFLLIMSICVVFREMFNLIECFIKTEHYEIGSKTILIMLWISISYIITMIICGL